MVKYRLLVNKEKQRLYVLHKKEIVRTMKCSTGTEKKDQETPVGKYSIPKIEKTTDTEWIENEKERWKYGPWICYLVDNKGREVDIAIHGTDEPGKLGLPLSVGCIGVSNRNIIELVRNFVKVGTLVDIVD
jgi:lipoprotein-anchoring transpeptidase ErfK/SrfK